MGEENPFDGQPAEGFSMEFDADETKFMQILAKAKMDFDTPREQAMYELGCGSFDGKKFVANNTGVLLFGRKPQERFPQAYATCVRYHGNSMAKVIDRKDFYGDLFSMVDEAESFVKRHTRLAYLFDGFKRRDIEEYPYDAIKEAIINAVCHRDYEIQNNIFVNVFDDTVEVFSPGNIPNNQTLKQVYGHSNPRNRIILEAFHKASYVEKLGSGLKRMDELMLIHGLKKPQYEMSTVYFKVTFHGPEDKILELIKPSNVLDLREIGLNERQIKALNYLQNTGRLTRKEYGEKFVSSKTASARDLQELVKKGFIKTEGAGKRTTYSLIEWGETTKNGTKTGRNKNTEKQSL